jgi:hypothetical protein
MRMSAGRAEFFGARMAAHGLDTIEKYFAELRRFNMLRYAPQITCPALIIEAECGFAGGGGQRLIDVLAAPSQLVQLSEYQGADGHCGGLGQEIWSEVVYHWLRETLLPDRPQRPARRKKMTTEYPLRWMDGAACVASQGDWRCAWQQGKRGSR